MMQRKRFVENGIEYVRKGNYYLTNLAVPENKYEIGNMVTLEKSFLNRQKEAYTVA